MKFQLHVSGLNMLSRCGEQFRRRYIEGEKIQPGIGAVVGSAVDKSCMADLGRKQATGSLMDRQEVMEIARDHVAQAFSREEVAVDGDYESPEQARGQGIDDAVALAHLAHHDFAPIVSMDGLTLQRAFVLDAKGIDIQVAGTMDIHEGAAGRIRDLKTSKKTPGQDVADTSLQLTTYALAALVADGAVPSEMTLEYLVKLKAPKYVQLTTKRTEGDFPHLLRRIEQATKAMESGVFSPAPLDAWWCSARWCGYHATCRFAKNPVSISLAA